MSLNTKHSRLLRAVVLVAHKMRDAHPYVLFRSGTMICVTGACDGGHHAIPYNRSNGVGETLNSKNGRLEVLVMGRGMAWLSDRWTPASVRLE